MISIKSLNKYFNKGRDNEVHVINGITVELPEKGMTAIFGKSGCGKTTLLNVIGGLDNYQSGNLTIEGNDIGKHTDEIRNKYIGYIFQNYNLNKQETVYENVADALILCGMHDEEAIKERVLAALKNVGMEMYVNRTPDTLSGGQQQRIAIARAIVKNPKIILADEPTGNLDEANTIMIMDLLRTIADNHLVVLVTHEANLVDYYCDTVINLEDGKIVDVRQNNVTGGYVSRDKNDIYLGEFDRHEEKGENVEIEYFGEAKELKLRVVNKGGNLYLQINSPDVKIIDESSEIRLKEGKFEELEAHKDKNTVDMSSLPPMKEGGDETGFGSRFGKLFTFASSFRSGYRSNVRRMKKGTKMLSILMCLAAVVMVIMTARFGTAIRSLMDVETKYDSKVFYVYTPDAQTYEKLQNAMNDPESGIDYIRITNTNIPGTSEISFVSGCFESFNSEKAGYLNANTTLLSTSLIKECELIAGNTDVSKLKEHEIIITTAVADKLIEASTLSYIKNYADLIGLVSLNVNIGGTSCTITGVIKSNENAIYLSDMGLAMFNLAYNPGSGLVAASSSGREVQPGHVIVAVDEQSSSVKPMSEIKISGKTFIVDRFVRKCQTYSEWLKKNGYSVQTPEEIAKNKNIKFGQAIIEYFAYADEYLLDKTIFGYDDMSNWLVIKKNLFSAKCVSLQPYDNASENEGNYPYLYYNAVKYYEKNGVYPDESEISENVRQMTDDYNTEAEAYYHEFYREGGYRWYSYGLAKIIMEDSDFAYCTLNYGETDEAAAGSFEITRWNLESEEMYRRFTIVHSDNVEKTEAYLKNLYPNSGILPNNEKEITLPDDFRVRYLSESRAEIVKSLVSLGVITLLISICIYFIMRSSLMTRVKEIGIYRAIGTSKKNIIFRFLIEATVLTTMLVFIALLLASIGIFYMTSITPVFKSVLYYPIWLGAALACVMYAICLFCGTAPVTSLLRKTPAQIIAKYDI